MRPRESRQTPGQETLPHSRTPSSNLEGLTGRRLPYQWSRHVERARGNPRCEGTLTHSQEHLGLEKEG